MVRVCKSVKRLVASCLLVYKMSKVLKLTVDQIVQRKSEMYQIMKKTAKLFLPFTATGNEGSFIYLLDIIITIFVCCYYTQF